MIWSLWFRGEPRTHEENLSSLAEFTTEPLHTHTEQLSFNKLISDNYIWYNKVWKIDKQFHTANLLKLNGTSVGGVLKHIVFSKKIGGLAALSW